MSGLIDTNILIYAVNKDSTSYSKAHSFLQEKIEGPGPVYLCWPVLYEFLRITTHPKIFSQPLSWKEGWVFLQEIVSQPNVTLLYEGEDHMNLLHDLLKQTRNPHGNFIHDCHIATILKENGVGLIYTHDLDFRHFPFLEVIDPIAN